MLVARSFRRLSILAIAGLVSLLAALPVAGQCEPRESFACTDFLTMSSEDFDRILDRVHRFPGTERLENRRDLCRVLVRGQAGSDCDQARREYLILVLNLATLELDRDCCYEHPDGRELRAAEAAREIADLIHNGACRRALRLADGANAGRNLYACGNRRRDDDDDDDDLDRVASACSPETIGFWKRECRDPERLRPHLDDLRDIRAFRDIDSPEDICAHLAGGGGVCGAAEAQMTAVVLNLSSERLQPGCELRSVGQNREHETVRDAVRTARALLAGGDCAKVNGILAPINSGGHLDRHQDRFEADPDDDDRGHGRGRGKSKGKGKGKGKGRP